MVLPIAPEQLRQKLIADGLITAEQFDALAEEAQRKQQAIIDILVADRRVDGEYINGFIAETLGVQRARFDLQPLDAAIVKLLPETAARQRQAIVFKREQDGSYGIAMADPGDLEALKFIGQYLGTGVVPYLATPQELNRGFLVYGVQSASDFKRIIEENVQASLRSGAKSAEEAAAALPMVAIVDNLLSYGASSGASDIHVEVLEDATLIRYRIDGALIEVMRIPKEVHAAISARIKLLAGLKIDEHYKPQDGRFRYQLVNQTVDCRVSVMPTYYGEKSVLRLLGATSKPLSLEELGMFDAIGASVTRNSQKAYGMIVVCGPTGSGKSTTLYAMMNLLNKPGVNMVTVEDPIEYNMRYVNQTQINPQAGITFASGIRALLRQDPDIIMVGEIRDSETAGIAVQSALTGHLVLTTLHTNDAPTAIPRLVDLAVPPFLVGSVLNVIVAQRLVRKICAVCISSYQVDDVIKQTITAQFDELGIPAAERHLPSILYKGKGCASCNFAGYRGRVGIFEVLEVGEPIKKLVTAQQTDLEQLRTVARTQGMKSMFEDGIDKAQRAITTVEEVLRVIRE